MNRMLLFERRIQMDQVLSAAGWHKTSPFFLQETLRFCQSGASTWVLEAGRRSGKTDNNERMAVAQACFGDWEASPGDTGNVAIVNPTLSLSRDQLKSICSMLEALGEPFSATADRVRLKRRPAEFRALACTMQSVVGMTCIAIVGDELAHWRLDDTGTNPAREVLSKLKPTMATIPSAFQILSSSPDSIYTHHYEMVLEGDTRHQLVSHAATWEANPTISKAQTQQLEPNERVWSREYAAIASAHTAEPVFRKEDIARALAESTDRGRPNGARVCTLDTAGGGKEGDAMCWASVGWNVLDGGRRVSMAI